MREVTVRELVLNEMSYGDIDSVLDALCPPGTLRVIDRRPRPCPECNGTGNHFYESAAWNRWAGRVTRNLMTPSCWRLLRLR